MSNVYVNFVTANQSRDRIGASLQIVDAAGVLATAAITSSGTSQQSTAAPSDCVVEVTNDGGDDLIIAAGANPVALQAGGLMILARTTRQFWIGKGLKIAVINAV